MTEKIIFNSFWTAPVDSTGVAVQLPAPAPREFTVLDCVFPSAYATSFMNINEVKGTVLMHCKHSIVPVPVLRVFRSAEKF